MKNFKRIIKSSFAVVLACIMLFSVACKKDPVTPDDQPPEDLGPNSISFYKESLDLTVGDKETNKALVDKWFAKVITPDNAETELK